MKHLLFSNSFEKEAVEEDLKEVEGGFRRISVKKKTGIIRRLLPFKLTLSIQMYIYFRYYQTNREKLIIFFLAWPTAVAMKNRESRAGHINIKKMLSKCCDVIKFVYHCP